MLEIKGEHIPSRVASATWTSVRESCLARGKADSSAIHSRTKWYQPSARRMPRSLLNHRLSPDPEGPMQRLQNSPDRGRLEGRWPSFTSLQQRKGGVRAKRTLISSSDIRRLFLTITVSSKSK